MDVEWIAVRMIREIDNWKELDPVIEIQVSTEIFEAMIQAGIKHQDHSGIEGYRTFYGVPMVINDRYVSGWWSETTARGITTIHSINGEKRFPALGGRIGRA